MGGFAKCYQQGEAVRALGFAGKIFGQKNKTRKTLFFFFFSAHKKNIYKKEKKEEKKGKERKDKELLESPGNGLCKIHLMGSVSVIHW